MVRPTIDGDAANRSRHTVSDITTSGSADSSAPGGSSAPAIGRAPSIGSSASLTNAAGTIAGSPTPVRLTGPVAYAAMRSTAVLSRAQSVKSGYDEKLPDRSGPAIVVSMATSRDASAKGSGFSTTPHTTLKIATVPPMPIARIAIAKAATSGARASDRAP